MVLFAGLAKLIFTTYDNLNDLLTPQRDAPSYNNVAKQGDDTKYKVSDNGHEVDSKENVDELEVTTGEDPGAPGGKWCSVFSVFGRVLYVLTKRWFFHIQAQLKLKVFKEHLMRGKQKEII